MSRTVGVVGDRIRTLKARLHYLGSVSDSSNFRCRVSFWKSLYMDSASGDPNFFSVPRTVILA